MYLRILKLIKKYTKLMEQGRETITFKEVTKDLRQILRDRRG